MRRMRIAVTLLAMGAALFSTLFFYTSNTAADDAFITLRYAHNLADGHGFRYNPGGERIEGFSSPLHVLVLAGALALGTDPWPTVQFFSIAGFVAAAGVLAWRGTGRLGPLWGAALAVAFAFNPGAAFWGRGGLETTLFTALAVLALALHAGWRWSAMGAAAGLLAVCRPEGFLFALPLFAGAAFELFRTGRPLKDLLRPLGAFLAFPVSWLAFRLLYFGDVFPNTYYAKMDGVRADQVARGLDYLGSYLERSEIQVPLAVFVLGLAVHLVRRRERRVPDTWLLTGAGMIAASFFFSLASGGDHMGNHRFLVPATPLILAGAAWAARDLATLPPSRPAAIAAAALLGFLFLSQPLRIVSHDLRHPTYPLDRPIGLVEPLDDGSRADRVRLGIVLKGALPPETVLAIVPAGAVPYLTGFETIDMLGLNDREIGRQKIPDMGSGRMGHEKGNGRMVLDRRPDVIMMRNYANPPGLEPAPPESSDLAYRPIREIWEDPEFHIDYEAFVVPVGDGKSYTLHRRR